VAYIYTTGGDGGETSLPDGARTRKDDPRVELLGALDEVNCFIGLARPAVIDSELDDVLEFIQQGLFNCGGALGRNPGSNGSIISSDDIRALERTIDKYSKRGGGFEGFVLPGCDEASARLHVARAVMRRAERAAVAADAKTSIDANVIAFLNRASDLLYVVARYIGSGNECPWHPDVPAPH